MKVKCFCCSGQATIRVECGLWTSYRCDQDLDLDCLFSDGDQRFTLTRQPQGFDTGDERYRSGLRLDAVALQPA